MHLNLGNFYHADTPTLMLEASQQSSRTHSADGFADITELEIRDFNALAYSSRQVAVGASVGYARCLWLTDVRPKYARELAVEVMTPLGHDHVGTREVTVHQLTAGSQGPTSCCPTCMRIRNTLATPDAYARRSACNPKCLMTQRGLGNAWQRAGV